MDLAGTALGVAGPPAWVWSPGAGERGVSPKTQGMVGSEVTQAVLGCRLVPDDGAIEDIKHTVSFECMHDGACGRHEVNTNAHIRLWPHLPIAGKSSQLADLLLEVMGCGYRWVCNPSLESRVLAFALPWRPLLGTLAAVQATQEQFAQRSNWVLNWEQHLCGQTAPAFRKFFTLTPSGPHTVYWRIKPWAWSNTGKLPWKNLHFLEGGAHVTAFPRLYISSNLKSSSFFSGQDCLPMQGVWTWCLVGSSDPPCLVTKKHEMEAEALL